MNVSFFKRIIPIFLMMMVLCKNASAQQFKNEEELKKEASRLFDEDEFTKAYNLYAQLVSNYPNDPDLNYRLGVCMLYSEPDKKKCYTYLNLAANHPKDAPRDAKFYLAKAYHMNYKFDEAIKLYNQYKSIGSEKQIKRLQVDREIQACKNGKRLLASMSELVVMSKKQLAEADYFRSYDLTNVGGKLLVKPPDFKTAVDKRKKDNSIIYIPKSGERIYFSSYGEDGETGRDIYFAIRMANGTFAKPQKVKGINTDFDEDYPFLHPNGRTLYFSSKGHNSMGGYDIFKTTYNEETDTWSTPVNMEFPINSPDDDYLFVTDLDEKVAYFSTGRQSPPGKIDVLKINTERRPMEFAVLKGTVLKDNAEQSLKSKITVKSMEDDRVVGTFQAQDNGDYYMEIPNGGKFIFTVETPGMPTQSDKVSLPMAMTMRPFKQTIEYGNKILKIKNYFDSPPDEEDYLRYLEMIEKKAKLDVNADKVMAVPNPTLLAANNATNSAVATTNPTATENGTGRTESDNDPRTKDLNLNNGSTDAVKTPTTTTLANNKTLSENAKKTASSAKTEAAKADQDYADAQELANAKKIEADDLQKKAEEAMKGATAITGDEAKKNEEIQKATLIKQEADNATSTATTLQTLAQNLESDAKAKQSVAILNEQYAKELDKLTLNKNNKEAATKAEELKKQIADASTQKSKADETYASIKTALETKQVEVTKAENKSTKLKTDAEEVKKEISLTDSELAKTKDKTLKENLIAQKTELNSELETKNKDVIKTDADVARLKKEVIALQDQVAMADKVKTSDFGKPAPNSIAATNNTTSSNPTTNIKSGAYESLNTDYSKQLSSVANPSEKSGLQQSNNILYDYNKKLDNQIVMDKADLKLAKKPDEKKRIQDEIKQLESQKTSNQTQIADNSNKLKALEPAVATSSIGEVVSSTIPEGTNTAEPKNNSTQPTTSTSIAANTGNPTATNSNTVSTSENNNTTATTTNTAGAVSTNNATKQNYPTNAIFDGADDLNKLSALKSGITDNTNPAFTFKDYKEQSSVSLKTDADLKLQKADETKNALTASIAKVEEDIKNAPPVVNSNNPEVVNQQGDQFAKEATALKIEAAGYQGADKERLMNEAREKDKLANDKHLEASDLEKNRNKNIYEVNNQNIDDLVTINKSNPADKNEALKLNDEAKLFFKQASAIREEANAQSNVAAKLGTISNAEEKETEAIQKQNKALELLVKANAGFNLKKADTGASPSANKEALASVTKEFDKLNNEKIDAYMALSKANQNEIKLQSGKLNAKPSIKNNTNKQAVEYKKQADALNKDAVTLISKAVTEPNAAIKQNLLADANKKEIDAIGALNNANALLEGKSVEPLASNTTQPKNNTTEPLANNTEPKNNINNSTGSKNNTGNGLNTTEPKNMTSEPVANNTELKNTTESKTNSNSTQEPKNNTTEPVANNTQPKNTAGNEIKNNTSEPTSNEQNLNNVSSADPKAYKSPEADKIKNDAVAALKTIEEEKAKVESEIKNTPPKETPAAELVTSIKKQNVLGDSLNKQARALRADAATKTTPAEKDSLITKAKALETVANENKVQAAETQGTLNDATYKTYNDAIAQMMSAAQGKPEYEQVQMLATEAASTKKQADEIRKESAGQSSAQAKLGGYNNAEEKELELLMKQEQAISILKKYSPAYVVPEPKVVSSNASPELVAKLNDLNNKQVTELEKQNTAYVMEQEAASKALPKTLNNTQKAIKSNSDNLIVQAKSLITKANQTSDPVQKKELLAQATKKGEESVAELNKVAEAKAGTAVASNNPKNPSANSGQAKEPKVKEPKTSEPKTTEPKTSEPLASNSSTGSGQTESKTNEPKVKEPKTPKVKEPKTSNQEPKTSEPVANNPTIKSGQVPPRTENNSAPEPNAVAIKVEGLEIKTSNAYSASNPIPVDAKMPEGLVFRVQIGAFRAKINDSEFKGLEPVNAQTTPNGWIRYVAGNFNKFEIANGVKNDLRNLGYKDAFVVGYYDGQRITTGEALAILEKNGTPANITGGDQTAGIGATANVPKNPAMSPGNPNATEATDPVSVVKDLNQMNGLLFTVQVGLFSRPINKYQIYNLRPIYSEHLPNGLWRYTAGIYNLENRVKEDQGKVNALGIKDAFSSAYLNGKRIPIAQGVQIQKDSANIKMEAENPIIFGDNSNLPPIPASNNPKLATTENTSGVPANTNQPSVAPFSNGVSSAPAPTAENGVKADEAGISFKIQIGAYRNQVPNETAAKFLTIKTWPIANKTINGLYLYTVGNFVDAKSANKLKDEVKALGLNDAFITVYKDGVKLYGNEANSYINK